MVPDETVAEHERLGCAVASRSDDEVVAPRRTWYGECFPPHVKTGVFLRVTGSLSAAQIAGETNQLLTPSRTGREREQGGSVVKRCIFATRDEGLTTRELMTIVAVAMIVALLSALGLAACGTDAEKALSASPEPTAPSASVDLSGDADSLMAQAKDLAKKTYELEGLILEGHIMMALIAEDAAAAKPEFAEARKLLGEAQANETAIVALLDQVTRLDAGEALTNYAGQQKEIAELRLLVFSDYYEGLLAQLEALWEKGKPSDAEMEKLFSEIEQSGPDDPLAHLEEKGQASREYFRASGLPDRYYMNNGLGEVYDTPNGESEEEMGGILLADGIQFEGPEVMTEEGVPEEAWASFEMPLAEAMRAQRAALEEAGWSVKVTSSGATRSVLTARNSYWKATFTFEKKGDDVGKVVIVTKKL